MNNELAVKTAVCTEYEGLLEECQHAWKTWNEQRAEIHESGMRGKKTDDTLRKLQANYAKAYARLRSHTCYCETCRWVSKMERHDYEHDPRVISESRMSA
jgi:hypothetical protein